MKRDLENALHSWKEDTKRKPLLVRGARQVGKTWLVREFATSTSLNLVEINFELQPQLKNCFSDLRPQEVVRQIHLSTGQEVLAGKSLLFLDEIQDCPNAIMALRYFHEQLPALHIIGAGSLLEFALEAENFRMPVGRVQYAYLRPLSFGEFLTATGDVVLRDYLQDLKVADEVSEAVHVRALTRLKDYLFVGGMPEAVDAYLTDTDGQFAGIERTHLSILQTYRQDFGKYARFSRHHHLDDVFETAPGLVGQKYKYANVNRDVRAHYIKESLQMLEKAGVVHRVFHSSGTGLPFAAHKKEKMFKILFLDVGLMQRAMGVSRDIYLSADLIAAYQGAVAEQYVGQQLLSLFEPYHEPDLYYWQREKKSSSAEVDYLWQVGAAILPIEVKAGKTGTLKSMRLFIEENAAPLGVRFSLLPISYVDRVLSLPLYAIEALPGVARQMLVDLG